MGSGQRLVCSGDAYTHRFDRITQDLSNVVQCMDDSLLWDDNVKSMFDFKCKYMSTCSRVGINFNQKKFTFAKDEVRYVGFKLTKDLIVAADSMTASILNFPDPRNTTDARAFFGLVKQVSIAFTKCDDAFWHLLSPKVKFLWTEELSCEFAVAKVIL